jgi:hypothetical protein
MAYPVEVRVTERLAATCVQLKVASGHESVSFMVRTLASVARNEV